MPNASLGENIIVHHLQSRNDNTTTTAIRIHSFLKLADYTPEGPWAIIVHHCPELFSKDTGHRRVSRRYNHVLLLLVDD